MSEQERSSLNEQSQEPEQLPPANHGPDPVPFDW